MLFRLTFTVKCFLLDDPSFLVPEYIFFSRHFKSFYREDPTNIKAI